MTTDPIASVSPTVRDTNKYCIMPDLTTQEFANLADAISTYGACDPIVVDEEGELIDGRQRLKIYNEKGIKTYPVRVVSGWDEDQKRHYVLSTNCSRRHLSRSQKRELIRNELLYSPESSNRWLASICGSDKNTVLSVRRNLVAAGEIPHLTELKGIDKKSYKVTSILSETPSRAKRALHALSELGDDAPKNMITLKSAERRVSVKQRNEKVLAPVSPTPDSDIRLFHSDFRELNTLNCLEKGSVRLIVTDPPWAKEDLPLWSDLADWAYDALQSGGVLAALAPIHLHPKIHDALSMKLFYWWQTTVFLKGQHSNMPQYKISNGYRTFFLYSKGPVEQDHCFLDTMVSGGVEKDYHPWQQNLDMFSNLVRELSKPGDLVADPMGGSFTSAVACKQLGRRFVGCDVDPKCIPIGLERLSKVNLEQIALA